MAPAAMRDGNPHSGDRRQELLAKWKLGTLTYEESLELRDILAQEASRADEQWKQLIGLGLIALFLYALTRPREEAMPRSESTSLHRLRPTPSGSAGFRRIFLAAWRGASLSPGGCPGR